MGDEVEESAEKTEVVAETTAPEASENADTSSGMEFSDSASNGSETLEKGEEKQEQAPSVEKPWKNEKNAEDARKRREAERQAELKATREQAIIDALGGVNPYTSEKMEDGSDVQEYLNMKQIEKNGGDPLSDYSKFLKAKAKEQEKTQEDEKREAEWVRKDREDFAVKYPNVKIADLVADKMFQKFAKGKLGVGKTSIVELYSDYNEFTNELAKISEERAKTKAAQILANNAATTGRLSSETPAAQKSIDQMTSAEFKEFEKKVERGEIKL